MDLRLVSFIPGRDLLGTLIAIDSVLPAYIILAELISKRKPPWPEVIVPCKELHLLGTRDQDVNERVDLLWFLGLLTDLCHYKVVGNLRLELNGFIWRALVAYQADLAGMQKVEARRDVNLFILSFDPGELVHDLVAPLVEAFVPDVHLRVEDPKEAETLLREYFYGDVHNLRIRHRGVVQVELVV